MHSFEVLSEMFKERFGVQHFPLSHQLYTSLRIILLDWVASA
jgi:hypothetical protein